MCIRDSIYRDLYLEWDVLMDGKSHDSGHGHGQGLGHIKGCGQGLEGRITRFWMLGGLCNRGVLECPSYFSLFSPPSPKMGDQMVNYKHRKNCECCPVSQLIVRKQRLLLIYVLNCQYCNQCLKCHKSL